MAMLESHAKSSAALRLLYLDTIDRAEAINSELTMQKQNFMTEPNRLREEIKTL